MKEIVIVSTEIDDDAVIDFINSKDEPDVLLKVWSQTFDVVCRFSAAGDDGTNIDCIMSLVTINTNQPIYLARGRLVTTHEKRQLINQHAGIVANKFTRVPTEDGTGTRWFTTLHTGWSFLDAWSQAKPGQPWNCSVVTRVDPNIGDVNKNTYIMVYANIGIDADTQLIIANY